MSVQNGQDVSAEVTNAAFMSRTENTDTVGTVGLLKPSGSGSLILDTQKTVNNIITATGMADQDATGLDFTGTTHIVDGSVKDALEDLDSALTTHFSDTSTHGVTGAIVGTTDSQVLTNKDIDGGTASNTSRLTIPKASKTTLDALTRKQGTIVYDTTSNKPYYDDGSSLKVIGSGSGGGVNFITNSDAESGIIGWSTYNDGFVTVPVDGTGGTATNLTFATSSTSPLSGTNSFVLSKSAANSLGQGVSYDFTIDAANKAKVLKIEFDYILDSGLFKAKETSATSDLIVYIYDVTNSKLIEPSSISLLSNSSTISDKFSATFQSASNSTSYRLILHVARPSADAWSLKFDNFSVSPSQYVYGTPVVDLGEYTPTFTNLGTVTVQKFEQYKVGKKLKVKFRFTAASGGASVATVSLPPGLTISTAGNQVVGTGWSQSTTSKDFFVTGVNGESVVRFIANNGAGGPFNGSDFGSGIVDGWFEVDVLGWSSSVQMSDGYDGRVVAFKAGSTGIAYPGTGTSFKFATATIDTLNSYNPTTGNYTILSSGTYKVGFTLNLGIGASATGQFINAGVYVNGSAVDFNTFRTVAGTTDINMTASFVMPLKAGDTVFIGVLGTNATLSASANSSYFQIEKLSGSPTISATETVGALYTGAPPTGTLNSSFNLVTFGTKVTDTHGAYSGGIYTVPVSGLYDIRAVVGINASSSVTSDISRLAVGINGTTATYQGPGYKASGSNSGYPSVSVTSVPLNAGDTVRILAKSDMGGLSYNSNASENYFSITKVK